jgi:hypothetical protein
MVRFTAKGESKQELHQNSHISISITYELRSCPGYKTLTERMKGNRQRVGIFLESSRSQYKVGSGLDLCAGEN